MPLSHNPLARTHNGKCKQVLLRKPIHQPNQKIYPHPLMPSLFRDRLANLHLLSVLKRCLSSEINERSIEHESLVFREPSQMANSTPSDLTPAQFLCIVKLSFNFETF
jgi:hypothetical protein